MRPRDQDAKRSPGKIRKKYRSLERSSSVKTVKRGHGLRTHPSKEGGIRQTPPLPRRSFRFSSCVYSLRPYGGSVTIAWIEFADRSSIQAKQSPTKREYPTSLRRAVLCLRSATVEEFILGLSTTNCGEFVQPFGVAT